MFHNIPLRRKCQTLLGYGGGESPISPEMGGELITVLLFIPA
jgi:hypothetical protein